MNNISIVGRLTKDVTLTTTPAKVQLCRFTVAVPNESKDKNGDRQADFFICVAWRETAENIAKYFKKGYPIGIIGSMNSRKYEKENGEIATIWELNVKNFSFVGGTFEEGAKVKKSKKKEEMTPIEDDEDLPF